MRLYNPNKKSSLWLKPGSSAAAHTNIGKALCVFMLAAALFVLIPCMKVTAFAEAPSTRAASLYGSGFAADGKISLLLYFTLPEDYCEGLTGELTVLGETTTIIPRSYSETDDDPTVCFVASVSAPCIHDEISLRLFDGDGNKISLYESGRRCADDCYVTTVYEHMKKMEECGEDIAEFAALMRNFCERVRANFKYDAEIPYEIDDTPIFKSLLEPYKADDSAELPVGITYAGMGVSFDDMSLRIYFELEEGADMTDYSFMIDGEPAELIKPTDIQRGDNIYMLVIKSIPATQYGEPHEITVNDVTMRNISLLSMACSIVNDDSYSAASKQLYFSMYYFCQAAKAFS